MNSFLKALSTSVGRKIVMAITGLLLVGFLISHLAGNLLLLQPADDKGEFAYDHYAHWLHDQMWLPIAETGLFVLFAAHIYLAVVTTRANREARKADYLQKKLKYEDRAPVAGDGWMFISGAIVLGFILLHLADFKMELRPDVTYDGLEPREKAVAVLQTPLSIGVYVVGTIFLWFHLAHGIASAFQTLGLRSTKTAEAIRWGSNLLAAALALGFMSLPLLALLGQFG